MMTDVGLFGEFNHINLPFFATSLGMAFKSGRKPLAFVSGMICETPSRMQEEIGPISILGTSMIVEESSTQEVTNAMSPPATRPPLIRGMVILKKVRRR